MLIGGFYSIDTSKLGDSYTEKLSLPLDISHNYDRCTFTNNGRTSTLYALQQLTMQTSKKTILLPDYLCLSVITAIEPSCFNYKFYKVNRDLSINLDSLEQNIDSETAAIYIIHYFGVPQSQNTLTAISKFSKAHDIFIIEDITQTLFSADSNKLGFGDYIVASTRKWFPITDGGICALNNALPMFDTPIYDSYNEASYKELLISIAREQYFQNPNLPKERYLDFEKRANASRYKDMLVRHMTEESKSILFNYNLSELMKTRRNNYETLYNGLKSNSHLSILQTEIIDNKKYIPFGLLILVENRDTFYDYLVSNNIIPEIQWNLPLEKYHPGNDAIYLSDHNIMIQCDQRYSETEMQYVVDIINRYNF